jgi:alpha-L-rhamnosidase
MLFRLFFVPARSRSLTLRAGRVFRRGCLLLALLPLPLRAANAPTDLLCNLLEHPEETVITTVAPEFGWIYNPSFRNDGQTGCRIIVASGSTLAAAGTGDLWDSGVVSSAASINVPYAGATLRTNTDYYWCVQTLDRAGQTSPFSVIQHFRTDTQLASPPVLPVTTNGLQWVWYPESTAATYATRYFRKTFVISTNLGVAGAQMLLTADDQFNLHVNGTFAGSSINWKQFSLFSLNSLVQVGTNTIAIAVSNLASGAGLTGRLDYRSADGSTNTVFIDGAWRTSSNLAANWNLPGFDDTAWSNAAVLGSYGVTPWNTTAVLPLTGLIYNSSTNLWANRYPLRFVAAAPVSVVNTAAKRWFIDFGQDAFGYATVHLNGSYSGTNVQARFGEMASGNAVNTAPSGSVRYGTSTFTLQNGDVVYPVRPPAYTGQTISPPTSFGVVMPFRYFELTNFPGTLTVTDVVQQRLAYEFNTHAASFSSSSAALNQIWTLCRNSMQWLSFDGIYVDGDRERKPYEADAYIQQLSAYAVDREFTIARYSFEYLLAHPTWPFEWKFHMIFIAWADYLQTGNPGLLYRYYDSLKADLFLSRARADGLIKGFPNNNQNGNDDIVDWPTSDRDGYVISSGSYSNFYSSVDNAFYYRCLQIMANVAAVTGRTNDAATFTANAARVYNSYNTSLWSSATQAYVDGEGTTHSAAHANFFPLAFGLVPASNQTAVVNYLHSRITAAKGMPPSVYGAQYLLEALFQGGDADTAIGLITTNGPRGWLNMISLGSTLTTEAWNFTDKPNEDWNHAWGAAAGNLIPRFILGLRPLTAGGGQVLIQPQLGQSLSWVQGTIPTIRGPVTISATNTPGQFQLLVNLPGNVTAIVMLPAFGATSPVALVDGNVVAGTAANNWLTVTNVGSGQHALWLSTNPAPATATLYNNWAAGWFGTNAANASLAGQTVDADGDGVNNFNEFVAGTNPLDAADRLRIADASYSSAGPAMTVTVAGKAGRHYTLQHTFTLDPPSWITANTQTANADNQAVILQDAPLSGATQAFLRVMVTYP